MRYRLQIRMLCHRYPPRWPCWALGMWLLLAVVLAGCDSSVPSSAPNPGRVTATPADPVAVPAREDDSMSGTVLIWHSWIDADHEALTAILDRIRAEHPRLVLAPQFVEAHQVPTRLLNAILAGEGPQLLLAPASRYPELKDDELIIPFNTVVQAEDLALFVSPALYGLIHDAQLMGLPIWAETVMLYVNTDMWPWAKVPDTTAQLLELAAQADQPFLGLYQNLFHLYWGLPAYGSVLFDADYRVVLDQSVGAAEFLTWLAAASATPGIDVSRDYARLQQAFQNQELALLVDGPWNLSAFHLALGDALRIREIPSGPAGVARPWLTTEAIFLIAGQTPEQQLISARTALLMTDSEQILIEKAQRLPAIQDQMNIGPASVQEFRELLSLTHHMAHRHEMTSVWRHGQDMLQHAVTSGDDTEALVQQFALMVNEENGK